MATHPDLIVVVLSGGCFFEGDITVFDVVTLVDRYPTKVVWYSVASQSQSFVDGDGSFATVDEGDYLKTTEFGSVVSEIIVRASAGSSSTSGEIKKVCPDWRDRRPTRRQGQNGRWSALPHVRGASGVIRDLRGATTECSGRACAERASRCVLSRPITA